jgi:hypothetical protein
MILGNLNGIFLVAGVQGNTFLRNLITGNPPVQVSLDSPSTTGYDIKNLAAADANAFEGNSCLSSLNAPCPSVGASLTADPNPITVTGNARYGITTLHWNAPGAQVVEVHVASPNGPVLTRAGYRGSAQTGLWVSDGTIFYLQDVTGGKPLTSDYTLATLVVHLQQSSSASVFHLPGGTYGAPILLALALCGVVLVQPGSRVKRARTAIRALIVVSLAVTGFRASAQGGQASAQRADAKLDQMIANHTNPNELARYVFDTRGCKACHTVGHDGKLGFTARGSETAKGFEGCIAMLTAMSHIAQVPPDRRSPQQVKKAARFNEYGCTFCHQIAPAKMAMTDVGTKLAGLHLGCVDIEKTLATKR